MDTSFETFEEGRDARAPQAARTSPPLPAAPLSEAPASTAPAPARDRADQRVPWLRGLSALHIRLILLVATSMLPLVILTGVVVYQSYEKTRADAADRVLQITRSTISAVDRELQNHIAALEVLALSPALQSGDFQAFGAEAARFVSRSPAANTGIGVTDADGQILFTTSTRVGAANLRRTDQDTIARVFTTGRPQVSNMYMGAVSKRPAFTVDVPVIRDGRVVYDLVFNPPLALYQDILKNLNLPKDWVVSIFDRELQHVARIPARGDGSTLTSGSPSLNQAVRGRGDGIVETTSLEGTRILTAFSRSPDTGWLVAVGVPMNTFSAPAMQSIAVVLGFGILLTMLGLFAASRLATQRMRAEAHRDLLINELNHRVKNTLGAVLAIVSHGLRDAPASAVHKRAIETRLLALSHAHDILSAQNWESADLRELAASILEPYAARVRLNGPHLTLKPRIAIALALILNELATNAAKYGALSSAAGVVDMTWMLRDEAGQEGFPQRPPCLRLEWRESGGPPVTPPEKPGYGTRFITRAVSAELKGSYSAWYPADGHTCVIEIPL